MNFKDIQYGDEKKIKELANQVSKMVYAPVYYLLKNKEDTEEVVQDTLLKIINIILDTPNDLPNFQNINSFKAWSIRIGINKAKDKLRFNNQKKRSALKQAIDIKSVEYSIKSSDIQFQPEQSLIDDEKTTFLWKCIDLLAENQRLALILVKIEGYSMKDAANIMDTTPKAVESLLSRAKEKVRKLIHSKEA